MSASGPDRHQALAQYRKRAGGYDLRTRLLGRYRRSALERLSLGPGDTVIDVACGTGANFELIERSIGPTGRLTGVDLSPEMLAVAQERIREAGWRNVVLIEAPVEEAPLGTDADAALFSFTHDVLQSEAAVANVMAALKPGARVSTVGAKLAPTWRFPVNAAVWAVSRQFITTFSGMGQPWAKLEPHLTQLTVQSVAGGGAYIASGTRRANGS